MEPGYLRLHFTLENKEFYQLSLIISHHRKIRPRELGGDGGKDIMRIIYDIDPYKNEEKVRLIS